MARDAFPIHGELASLIGRYVLRCWSDSLTRTHRSFRGHPRLLFTSVLRSSDLRYFDVWRRKWKSSTYHVGVYIPFVSAFLFLSLSMMRCQRYFCDWRTTLTSDVLLIQSFDRSAEIISECLNSKRFGVWSILLASLYQRGRTISLELFLEVINV